MPTKRKIIFDDYDTAVNGLWTLATWALSDAEPSTNYIDVPGRLDGPLDASTALTGDVQYRPRTLEATLESSEGTRLEREARIDYMVNKLHGQRVKIWLPDDAGHYLIGRLRIERGYNDLAHAAVKVTATCEPWKYENDETVKEAEVTNSTVNVVLENTRRPACPVIHVQGEVLLGYEGSSYALNEGTYQLPDIQLTEEGHTVQVSGSGLVSFVYRKAVL